MKFKLKVISFILIQSFLLLDFTFAGGTQLNSSLQTSYLSPAIKIDSQILINDFQNIYAAKSENDRETDYYKRLFDERLEEIEDGRLVQKFRFDRKRNAANYLLNSIPDGVEELPSLREHVEKILKHVCLIVSLRRGSGSWRHEFFLKLLKKLLMYKKIRPETKTLLKRLISEEHDEEFLAKVVVEIAEYEGLKIETTDMISTIISLMDDPGNYHYGWNAKSLLSIARSIRDYVWLGDTKIVLLKKALSYATSIEVRHSWINFKEEREEISRGISFGEFYDEMVHGDKPRAFVHLEEQEREHISSRNFKALLLAEIASEMAKVRGLESEAKEGFKRALDIVWSFEYRSKINEIKKSSLLSKDKNRDNSSLKSLLIPLLTPIFIALTYGFGFASEDIIENLKNLTSRSWLIAAYVLVITISVILLAWQFIKEMIEDELHNRKLKKESEQEMAAVKQTLIDFGITPEEGNISIYNYIKHYFRDEKVKEAVLENFELIKECFRENVAIQDIHYLRMDLPQPDTGFDPMFYDHSQEIYIGNRTLEEAGFANKT
ncbi:MAG: hypothetical protein KJ923_02025, partial [Candidatus Omnitrophica bacterium]|nr:hypothetical protein [Candidatus Omnitrophota bacterium]